MQTAKTRQMLRLLVDINPGIAATTVAVALGVDKRTVLRHAEKDEERGYLRLVRGKKGRGYMTRIYPVR